MKVPQPPRTDEERERKTFEEQTVKYHRSLKTDLLSLTVSNPPTQAEVQSIADKIDELLGKIDT